MTPEPAEAARLESLHRLQILDSPPEPTFDRLTALVATLLDVPSACISIVDRERVWFKSRYGIDIPEVPRVPGLCTTAIESDATRYLPDTLLDPIAKDNPIVASGVRFYVGAPLKTVDGHRIGTLCAFGPEPREMTERELLWFRELGDLVMHEIDLRRRSNELARTEEALAKAQRLESIGMVAGGVAHDFNNLLGGILGNAGLLRQELDNPTAAVELLDEIELVTRRAADLAGQVLAYMGEGEQDQTVPIDVNALVRETGYMLDSALHEGTVLVQELSDEQFVVRANRTALQQTLMNLITNASEAYQGEPGTVRLRTARHGDQVVFAVQDHGPGMDAATAERIFEPFYTTKRSGKGLGLAVVRRILKNLQGDIDVDTSPGAGTTIRVSLPASDEAPRLADAPTPRTSDAVGRGTILVVDDEAVILKLATRVLERGGFEVLQAAGGGPAVELFREHGDRITAIVLDLSMPDMNGRETLQAIRAAAGDELAVPVILSSGHTEQEATSRCVDQAIHCYLKKPYAPDDLLRQVQSLSAPS